MIRVWQDFNEYWRDLMFARPEDFDGEVSIGDRVLMYGDGLECEAVVDSVKDHGRGSLIYMRPDRDTLCDAEGQS